jgi:hypothetical protein
MRRYLQGNLALKSILHELTLVALSMDSTGLSLGRLWTSFEAHRRIWDFSILGKQYRTRSTIGVGLYILIYLHIYTLDFLVLR